MSNREMLELAAKAVGIVGNYYCDEYSEGIYIVDENDCGYGWSPHWDDGQALRLAVKLRMQLNIGDDGMVTAYAGGADQGCAEYIVEDIAHHTRSVIVYTAAQVGKGML